MQFAQALAQANLPVLELAVIAAAAAAAAAQPFSQAHGVESLKQKEAAQLWQMLDLSCHVRLSSSFRARMTLTCTGAVKLCLRATPSVRDVAALVSPLSHAPLMHRCCMPAKRSWDSCTVSASGAVQVRLLLGSVQSVRDCRRYAAEIILDANCSALAAL